MSIREIITKKLTEELSPQSLAITDESAEHDGHVGARATGETHFHVEIIANVFICKSRLECQRMIYHILRKEMQSDIHALSIDARKPPDSNFNS